MMKKSFLFLICVNPEANKEFKKTFVVISESYGLKPNKWINVRSNLFFYPNYEIYLHNYYEKFKWNFQ